MTERPFVTLDSSVGVKWFKEEAGRDAARSILVDHELRRIRIVVPTHFLHEVVSTVVRQEGADAGEKSWRMICEADLAVAGLDDTLALAAFEQCRLLGCTFYDALAPGLASMLGARLVSADRKAHGAYPGVELIG